jgi:hypothetical protein
MHHRLSPTQRLSIVALVFSKVIVYYRNMKLGNVNSVIYYAAGNYNRSTSFRQSLREREQNSRQKTFYT